MSDNTWSDLVKKSPADGTENPDPLGSAEEAVLSPLSGEEQKKLEELRSRIDLRDAQAISLYGAGAQREIADFSDRMLSQMREKDTGEAGELLQNLVLAIEEAGVDDLTDGKQGFFDSPARRLRKFRARCRRIEPMIAEIEGELDRCRMALLKDIGVFDAMYQKNLKYIRSLEIFIRAGEEKLAHERDVVLPELRKEAEGSSDPLAGQLVSDCESSIGRFEKKIYDLKQSRVIALQTAPQIRLVQNSDRILVDRIQGALTATIPLWKNQIVLALGLAGQKEVLYMQRQVTDTTDAMIRKNAETLKKGSVEIAKESEKGIAGIDTLKKANEDLLSTIQDTISIQKEGRAKRQQAEQELMQIEGALQRTLSREN